MAGHKNFKKLFQTSKRTVSKNAINITSHENREWHIRQGWKSKKLFMCTGVLKAFVVVLGENVA